MARQSTLTLVIEAKNQAKRVLAGAQREVRGFADGVKKRFKSAFQSIRRQVFSVQGALAGLAAVGALTALAKRAFDLGSEVEETASKFRTVFGPAVQQVNDFLDDFAAKAGLSRMEAQELAATTGAIAQGMGFAQEASASFTEEIVRLAGDLTSFNNIPIEETGRAIQAALAGEREQLKRLGIVLRETDVQQRAMANSGTANAEALTQQERAAATLELIAEKAGVAVGDLDRTQDSAANRARRLNAEWRTFTETLATAALPVLADVLGLVDENSSKLDEWSTSIRENQAVITAWGRVVLQTLKFVGQSVATLFRVPFELGQVIGASLRGVFSLLVGSVLRVVNQVVGHLNRMIEDLNKLPKVNIDFRFGEAPADRFLQDFNDQTENVWRNVQDGIGSVTALKDAWVDVFEASEAAARAQGGAAQAAQAGAPSGTPGGSASGGGGGGSSAGADLQVVGVDRFPSTVGPHLEQATAPEVDTSGLVEVRSAWQEIGLAIRDATENQRVMEQVMADMISGVIRGFTNAISAAFEAAVTGSQSMGEAFKSAMLNAVASVAEGMAQFYAAKAVAALGEGLLGNPAGFAAAAKFTAAAAAFGALAGVLRGVASGGGGAGRGVSARAGQQADRAGEARQPPATVIIRGGLLNMNDPRQRREFSEALENLTSRRVIIEGA